MNNAFETCRTGVAMTHGNISFQKRRMMALQPSGIGFSQSPCIARPTSHPAATPAAEATSALGQNNISVYPGCNPATFKTVTAARLVRAVPPLALDTSNEKLLEMFSQQPELQSVPVVDGGVPVGIISRHAIVDQFAPLFRLYGEKAYACFMDATPVVVEERISIQELCRTLEAADSRHLANGFIVTKQGRYIGMGTVPDLIREIARLMEG